MTGNGDLVIQYKKLGDPRVKWVTFVRGRNTEILFDKSELKVIRRREVYIWSLHRFNLIRPCGCCVIDIDIYLN